MELNKAITKLVDINCSVARFGDQPTIYEIFSWDHRQERIGQDCRQIADELQGMAEHLQAMHSGTGAITIRIFVSGDGIGPAVIDALAARGISAHPMLRDVERSMRRREKKEAEPPMIADQEGDGPWTMRTLEERRAFEAACGAPAPAGPYVQLTFEERVADFLASASDDKLAAMGLQRLNKVNFREFL